MALVHIPVAMRGVTGGAASVEVPGATIGELMVALDQVHPGLKARLVETGPAGEKLRPGLSIFVDGELPLGGLRAKVGPNSEVYIAPAIAGG